MNRGSKAVCVFCGSQFGKNPVFAQAAQLLGQGMGKRGWSLVYGGGDLGLMGVVAKSCISHGCKVVGVIPKFLDDAELVHPDLHELVVVEAMYERKRVMEERSDAFCVFPGGFGTLDELFEFVALLQLKQHSKPIILFNPQGFFDPLLLQIKHMMEQGFIQEKYKKLFHTASSVEEVFSILEGL